VNNASTGKCELVHIFLSVVQFQRT